MLLTTMEAGAAFKAKSLGDSALARTSRVLLVKAKDELHFVSANRLTPFSSGGRGVLALQ